MAPVDFVHLHLHTEYSLLDGLCRIVDDRGAPGELIQLTSKLKLPALAITDHGNMFGAVEFYSACVAEGIKPIIGMEVYVAPGDRREKTSRRTGNVLHHLTLLAKDEAGYKNLIGLSTRSWLEGFYYKPRVDKKLLNEYREGIIALSGCLQGEIPKLILAGEIERARLAISHYHEIFGPENFYLELMDNLLPEQRIINQKLIQFGREGNIPLVATNDVHYLHRKDAHAHEALLCIGTGKTLDDPEHMRFRSDEFYFKSPEEMKQLFREVPQSIENTIEIAEKCNLEMKFSGAWLPPYQTPSGLPPEDYLDQLCRQNLSQRYPETTPEVTNRLASELNVIKKMGLSTYFLIVRDFIEYAKGKDIPVGPGRGSGTGSLVAYVLGITNIDPLKYGLLFERFLNEERKGLPDLDIDFSDEGREEVINYVKQKYGENRVAQIATFGTLKARAVVRDVARVLKIPLSQVDRLAKLIPFGETLNGALSSVPELKEVIGELKAAYSTEAENRITQLVDIALQLEGVKRHLGMHAAGIVIGPEKLTSYVPFCKTSKGVTVTQYEGGWLEKLGLLKMDLLGIRNLTVIKNACQLLNANREEKVDMDNIPFDDKKTFKLLREAKTSGVFQIESAGMRDLLRKLKPTEFTDLIALVALYRPGPIGTGMVEDFIVCKHHRRKVRYLHPKLEPILAETYGVILYQEQVMRIARELADFSPGQADHLRRAMGKKIPEEIESQRDNFIQGAQKKGLSQSIARRVFDQMAEFGGYGFNKSHSAAYACVAYQTAWLKANYPLEYMTALLSSEVENTDKLVEYIKEAQAMGIKILPPDVGKSFAEFTMEGAAIRFGLAAVKNVGWGAIESMIKARESIGQEAEDRGQRAGGRGKGFNDFFEFCQNVDLRLVNRRVIESLIKSGAMDCFKLARAAMFSKVDEALSIATQRRNQKEIHQPSLFDTSKFSAKYGGIDIPDIEEWPDIKLLSFEKESLGLYMSRHPLTPYAKELRRYITHTSASLPDFPHHEMITLGGIITQVKKRRSKKGQLWALLKLEDLDGTVEGVVLPQSYERGMAKLLQMDERVIIKGKVDKTRQPPQVLVEEIVPLAKVRQSLNSVHISLKTVGLEKEVLKKLKTALLRYPGRKNLWLHLETPHHGIVDIKSRLGLKISDELKSHTESLLGEDTIWFE